MLVAACVPMGGTSALARILTWTLFDLGTCCFSSTTHLTYCLLHFSFHHPPEALNDCKDSRRHGGQKPRQRLRLEVQERSTMAQQKAINKKKQDKREAGLQSARSRSSSRRARRQRLEEDKKNGKYMHTTPLEVLEEADANGDLQKMGMFERIGPDSTSMDGPVTHARAMRGEIPMRGTNPNEPFRMEPQQKGSELKDQDGLKLTLEANLEIEIELKASIRGDLTLSLYA
ncbi:hypothetical protein P3342_005304 [Pyrenophora teres f. teres]|nr:hypothetical protein P3342_005304 [Pyrenophora teres f. teres]